MNIFDFRNRLVADYAAYVTSFIAIRDARIQQRVRSELDEGFLWPEPSIGLNPAFAGGAWIDELVRDGILHEECAGTLGLHPSEETANCAALPPPVVIVEIRSAAAVLLVSVASF